MRQVVTLRRNLLRWLLALLIGLSFSAAVASYIILGYFVNMAYDRALLDSLLSLATQVHFDQGRVLVALPEPALRILEFDKSDRIYYRISGPNGKLISGSANLPPAPPPDADNPTAPVLSDAMLKHHPIRMASLRLLHGGHPIYIQIAETLNKRARASREILWTIALPQLIIILLAVLAIRYGVSRCLAPLVHLEAQVAHRSPRDLRPITGDAAPEEVRSLVRAINTLMARLSKVYEVQRRFIADAAHQLRTPLAALKTQVELAVRSDDPAQIQTLLPQLASGIDQSSRLVTQLLALARAEHYADRSLVLKPVDLTTIARETTASWVLAALEKDIDIGFEGPVQPISIPGDALALNELIGNLLDNAVCYTPCAGTVTLRLWCEARQAHLTVEDNGPGIPEVERQRVFEPFYRLQNTDTNGCGLGLAIVRKLTLALGADCWLEPGTGGCGLTAHLMFTLLDPAEFTTPEAADRDCSVSSHKAFPANARQVPVSIPEYTGRVR